MADDIYNALSVRLAEATKVEGSWPYHAAPHVQLPPMARQSVHTELLSHPTHVLALVGPADSALPARPEWGYWT